MTEPVRKVLVTGASGFVGRQAVASLLEKGFSVHGTTLHGAPRPENGVTWHRIDLLKAAERSRLAQTVHASHLLHLAWYVEHGKFWTSEENDRWVDASVDLFKVFAEAGGRRAVFGGTCAEYDWNRTDMRRWREDDPCCPATPYGRAKLALAEEAFALSRSTGISLGWARFFFMFGIAEHKNRLIPHIVRGLLQNKKIALTSGGQIRDFMDTRDVGEALCQLLEAEQVTGAVNVASGHAISIADVARLLASLAGREEVLLDFGTGPSSEIDPAFMVADVSRLEREVGFKLSHALPERLAECLQWHRGQDIGD